MANQKQGACGRVDIGGQAVMEGVMGYYDGLGGISTQASTYEVAQAVDVPVILILDGKGQVFL